MSRRPNALIIGAGKAGSTSLHNYLNSHPAIFGSEIKELMYFSSNFGRGEGWYLSHFPEQDGVEVYFESTPQYTFRDELPFVAQRIHDFNPDMKLIYIIRHPVERIISHFNHWRRTQPERFSDIDAMLQNAAERRIFLDRTRYFHQLEQYRALFPDEQIHVTFLEDVQSDFVPTLNAIFAFLGVAEKADSIESKIYNKGATEKRGTRFGDSMSDENRASICRELSGDVQEILSHCGKPGDYWGAEFQ